MIDKKNINLTNNDGAKFRYSASRDPNAKKPDKSDVKRKIKEAITKRQIFWKTNRVFAAFVLAAVIILFSALSVYRAVSSRASVVKEYYNDSGIKIGVTNMIKESGSLLSLAEALDPGSEKVGEFRDLISELDSESPSPFWNDCDAAKTVRNKSEDVRNQITHLPNVKAADVENANDHFEKLVGNYERLGDSAEYREAAREYNDALEKFPAKLFPIEKAPVFDRFENAASSDDGTTAKEDDDDDSVTSMIAQAASVIKSKISHFSFLRIIGIIVAVVIIGKIAIGGMIKKRN